MNNARKKILLFDDFNTILMTERRILTKGPYDLITAKDGEEAVEGWPNVAMILMDVVMPKRNGFDAVRRIRAEATISDTSARCRTSRPTSGAASTPTPPSRSTPPN